MNQIEVGNLKAPKGNKALTNSSMTQILSILIFLFIMSTIFSILTPNFLTFSNIINIVRQITVISLLAFGMNFVILIGGIDLSIGSVVASSAMVAGVVHLSTGSFFLTITAAILSGTIVGFINGVIITKLKIPDFIATLSMMSVIRGFVMVYTKARPIYGFSDTFLNLGQGYIGPIPFPVVISLVVFFICYGVLRLTKFGCHIYAVGGNKEVARLSGINVDRVKILVYGISGTVAAISGILLAARIAAAVPIAGAGYEMDAITAVILGGTNLFGGRGSIVGTLLGMLVIGILANGLVLLGVDPFAIIILKGVILLVAIAISARRN